MFSLPEKHTLSLVLLASSALASPAAAELISNGGFETGSFADWTCTGADQCVIRNSPSNSFSGNYHLSGFRNTGFATLAQTVTTKASYEYEFSFAAQQSYIQDAGNIVRYSINGADPITADVTTEWSVITDTFVADGTSTSIEIFFETDGGTGSILIDDVSVIELGEFIEELLNDPEELARLAAASSALGQSIVLDAQALVGKRGQESIASRAQATRSKGPAAFGSDDATPQSLYTWVEFTGFRAEDDSDDREYSGGGLQLGADIAVSADFVAGLSFGIQDLNATAGGFEQQGQLYFVQPYLAYNSGNWSGEASLIYGQGAFEQMSDAGEGEGDSTLAAIAIHAGHDFTLSGGQVITPIFGLVYGEDTVEGKSGTLEDAGKETVEFTQVSLGAEWVQSLDAADITLGVHADWRDSSTGSDLVSDFLVDDGWTGRLEFGVVTELADGLDLNSSLGVSGLGGDLQQASVAIQVAYSF